MRERALIFLLPMFIYVFFFSLFFQKSLFFFVYANVWEPLFSPFLGTRLQYVYGVNGRVRLYI